MQYFVENWIESLNLQSLKAPLGVKIMINHNAWGKKGKARKCDWWCSILHNTLPRCYFSSSRQHTTKKSEKAFDDLPVFDDDDEGNEGKGLVGFWGGIRISWFFIAEKTRFWVSFEMFTKMLRKINENIGENSGKFSCFFSQKYILFRGFSIFWNFFVYLISYYLFLKTENNFRKI